MASISCTTESRRGRGRLHHLVGDAAGEIVLEEAQTLAQHVAVRQPAHAGRHRPGDHLVLDQVVGGGDHGAGDDGDERHPQQHAAVLADEILRRLGSLHQVDQVADEGHQRHLDQGAGKARHQQDGERRPDRLDVVDIERQKRIRRTNRCFVRESLDAGFEPAEHAKSSDFFVSGRRRRR
jgi:hypothetical protein